MTRRLEVLIEAFSVQEQLVGVLSRGQWHLEVGDYRTDKCGKFVP